MNINAVILGSINIDVVAMAERLPARGETVNGYSVDMYCGGKGANQAVQCSLMGLHTVLIGKVGSDTQGNTALENLKGKNIDCSYIEISDTDRTGCAAINVNPEGDNTLVYAPGANHHISKEIIDKAGDVISDAGIFLSVNELNLDAVYYGLEKAHHAGVTTVLNPAPAMPLPDHIFENIDYITPNETESEVYTGYRRDSMDPEEWKKKNVEWFLERGVKNIIITMGGNGSFFANKDSSFTVPAFSIKPVDTTAAGDSFHGGFAYGLLHGYNMETCLKIGNACGGLSAMTAGAQASIQPYEKVREFLGKQNVQI